MIDRSSNISVDSFFATEVVRSHLRDGDDWEELNRDLFDTSMMFAQDDEAGLRWCDENDYDGYTSYSSLDDLAQRATCFADLIAHLDRIAERFSGSLQWDLRGRSLQLDNLWVNVLEPGGHHPSHIHPHCVLSGTYYVHVPEGGASIRFEDPRLSQMMATPTPRTDAEVGRQRFVSVEPQAGDLLMWESWLRHEVRVNRVEDVRVSVSFNYRLD